MFCLPDDYLVALLAYVHIYLFFVFFFSSRRRHTRSLCDWSSDVCSSDLIAHNTYLAGHPYSWTTIGDMADLDAASMKDVQEWFKTYYGPSNVTLVLAGDIDAKTAKEKVEKYFGDIPPGPPVAHQEVWIAKMTGTHRQIVQDRVPQARIYKIWNMPQYGSADADYLDLVSDILSTGKTSRLYKRLIYDDQVQVIGVG